MVQCTACFYEEVYLPLLAQPFSVLQFLFCRPESGMKFALRDVKCSEIFSGKDSEGAQHNFGKPWWKQFALVSWIKNVLDFSLVTNSLGKNEAMLRGLDLKNQPPQYLKKGFWPILSFLQMCETLRVVFASESCACSDSIISTGAGTPAPFLELFILCSGVCSGWDQAGPCSQDCQERQW